MSEHEETPTRSFTLLGKKWVLQIDRFARRDVKAATDDKVDLFAAFNPKLYESLADPELLMDTLWALCKDQHAEISMDQFIRAFRGNVIDEAAAQLEGAILDFFPDRQRRMLTKAKEKGAAKVGLIEQVIDKAMTADDPETKSMLKYLSSPDSSDSTPVDLPTVS